MSSGNVLVYSESDRIAILNAYGRTPETVRDDIENIKEWMAKQAHLPEIAGDDLIERFLLLNKFRIEITKKKLDKYYTLRAILPDVYGINPVSAEMQKSMNVMYYITLPKLTKELYRVTIVKLKDHNPDNFDPLLYTAHALSIVEIRLREDYNMSDLQIFDFTGITLAHLIKFNPLFVRKCGLIVQNVLSTRIKGIHFINAPLFAESFFYLLKAVLNPKVMDRVHIHRDSESLHKIVPMEILPKELGGNEKSLDELNDNWTKKLHEYDQVFKRLRQMSVDEDLRAEKLPDGDFFGTEGNFRKLDLD